jgi:hypothetical protein
MIKFNQLLLTFVFATAGQITLMAQAANTECQGLQVNMKAVALPGQRVLNPIVDFGGSGGQLHPVPVLQTDFNVFPLPARSTCVVVTFSTQADPQDNHIVFQASIDNVPMLGHGTFLGLPTPVVVDPEETNLNNTRMLSYTFFAHVGPGVHTLRIRAASCCTSNPTGGLVIRAATAIVRY